MNDRRVAVLVDGDNISARYAGRVLSEARTWGRIDVARVYVAAGESAWLSMPGYRAIYASCGKNSTDMLLCIDAMELELVGGIEAFVLVTSDRDYTHLALRLRERGLAVLGLGEAKAPEEFRLACSRFLEISPGDDSAPEDSGGATAFDRKIRSMIAANSTAGRGMRLELLGPKMNKTHGAKIKSHGKSTWSAYLKSKPDLYAIDWTGDGQMVRFLPDGFAT